MNHVNKLSFLVDSFNITSCLNFISASKKKNVSLPYRDSIPSVHDFTFYCDVSKKLSSKKTQLIVNPTDEPMATLDRLKQDIAYAHSIAKDPSNYSEKPMVNAAFGKDNIIVGWVELNKEASSYAHTGMYNHILIKEYLKVRETHFCIIEKLPEGLLRIRHCTHNPLDFIKFDHIANLDFCNRYKSQFLSNQGFVIPEKMISNICKIKSSNIELINKVITSNYPVNEISELSSYHACNSGKYLNEYLLSSQNELHQTSILLEDKVSLFIDVLNSLYH